MPLTSPGDMPLRLVAMELAKTMQCRCDLDRWQPEYRTGHSWVCPIHKTAIQAAIRKER